MILAAVAAAMLALPMGAATWKSYGSYEPDTTLDSRDFMFFDPPAAGSKNIYFNAFSTASTIATRGTNPNAAVLQSHIESFGSENQWAILGVWTDCNNDGYVGHFESASREYPSQLANHAICAPHDGASWPTNCWKTVSPPGSPCPNWPATGYNNYRGWVTELIPIGSGETTTGDKRIIKDVKAAVWGDYGKPTDSGDESGGGTCAITPLPRGTTQSSGGLLTHADCYIDIMGRFNTVVDAAGDPLGLRFSDNDDGRSGPLGHIPTFGPEDSSNAIVHTGDCNADYLVRWDQTPLPTGVTSNLGTGVRPPGTHVNPMGNVPGTVNHTKESGPFATSQSDDEDGPNSTSNCDFQDDRGADFYGVLEGDFNGVSVTDKRAADWNFEFQTMTRGGVPLGVPFGPVTGNGAAGGAPNDGGVSAAAVAEGPSEWFGGSGTIKAFPVVQTRGTIAAGTFSADIANASWYSYYANVGSVTTDVADLPSSAIGIYGKTQCGTNTNGVHNGWNCNASLWNLAPDGTPEPDPYGILAYPGVSYRLADVDCYDGSIREAGVPVQPAAIGPAPCTFR